MTATAVAGVGAPIDPGLGARCPVCRAGRARAVLSLDELPVLINAQVAVDEARRVPVGRLDLVVCEDCAHLYNRSFDERLLDYDATYENSLHFSPSFRAWAETLRDRLVTSHDLRGKRVAELGSGPGHFLSMLCDAGVADARGFDPSYDADRLGAPSHPAVELSTERYPTDGALQVDLAFSQHVLEHLDDPVAALRDLAASVAAAGGTVYSEVPNGDLMLRDGALWDLIYEHRSYFVETSLRRAHRLAGLAVSDLGTAFGDQFLWAEARPDDQDGTVTDAAVAEPVAETVERAVRFGRDAVERIEQARLELTAMAGAGPVVLWGAGSKGMTWLNLVARDQPVTVVDINPRKTGCGVPGTGHRIDEPSALSGVGSATVLLANPAYRDEIAAQLAELGVDAHVAALWGDDR